LNVQVNPPRYKLEFTPLHEAQAEIKDQLGMLNVLRCGRRFGKSILLENVFSRYAVEGELIGWFTPDYKLMRPTYIRLAKMLGPFIKHSSKIDAVITLISGGGFEFWTLDNEDAGRSRYYDHAVIDEASLVTKGLQDIVEQAIMPTLLDRDGTLTIAGTPKGIDLDNFFYAACSNKSLGFKEFHYPTRMNPTLKPSAVAKLPERYPPLVYQQEFLAEFVDWTGDAFFARGKLLVDDQPVDYPTICDSVFAVIDSATKTGRDNDGTAVVYAAFSSRNYFAGAAPLIVLDYDISQIEGQYLLNWLPNVFRRLQELSETCGARLPTPGVFIEDKNSGMVLLQQCQTKKWPARAIDSKLTAMGKSERAIDVSGYVWQDKVKLSAYAYNKEVAYKGVKRNHLLSQVTGFRIGVKEAADDDLLDGFCYAAALALGNSAGF
jgi:hypothetical protein